MAYEIRGELSDGKRFRASAEALGEARELAKKAVRDGDCRRVDIFDPAISNITPIVPDEQIRAAVEAEVNAAEDGEEPG